MRFITDHLDQYGRELIGAVLLIAPSTCCRQRPGLVDRTHRAAGAQRDDEWRVENQRAITSVIRFTALVTSSSTGDLGARAWLDAGPGASRASWAWGPGAGTGAVHDKTRGRGDRPAGLVGRQFVAVCRSQSWVSDITNRATRGGFVFVAFVINVFSRPIVGWRVSASMRRDFVLNAPKQAIDVRGHHSLPDLVHHSD